VRDMSNGRAGSLSIPLAGLSNLPISAK
jgi:hypothetical protein